MCDFRLHKIGIEVACHQELVSVRSAPDGISDVLYGLGVGGGEIAPHNMTPPPPRPQLKADDVQAMEAELFYNKVIHLAVKISTPLR